MPKRTFLSLLVAAAAFGTSAAVLRAEVNTGATAAQESVVAKPTDSPLERNAKWHRNWHLYNDGTAVWALEATLTTSTPTSTSSTLPLWHDRAGIVKRAVQTMSFFTRFEVNFRILRVSPERMARFTTGAPITSVDGLNPDRFIKRPYLTHRLLKAANNAAVYLFDSDKLKPIVHEKVFKNLGLDFADVETVSQATLSQYQVGTAVAAETVFEEEVTIETTAARKTVLDVRERLKSSNMLRQVRDAIIKPIGSDDYYLLNRAGKLLISPERREQISQRLRLDLSKAMEVTPEEAAAIPTVKTITEATAAAEVNASAQ